MISGLSALMEMSSMVANGQNKHKLLEYKIDKMFLFTFHINQCCVLDVLAFLHSLLVCRKHAHTAYKENCLNYWKVSKCQNSSDENVTSLHQKKRQSRFMELALQFIKWLPVRFCMWLCIHLHIFYLRPRKKKRFVLQTLYT